VPFRQKDCHGFFGGLLPEEGPRQVVARILGISPRNDFSMLERIGGECAGAVTFLPEGTPLPKPDEAEYRPLSESELHGILEQLPRRPLMAGESGVRLSLAGAQSKLAVHVAEGRISLPLGGAPSTHILKPAITQYPGVVENEAFCLQLAGAIGLPAVTSSTHRIGEIAYILVERYDRRRDEEGRLRRIHQEDFCQALGVASEMKYQSEGGPSLKSCFALLRKASSRPVLDLRHLLDAHDLQHPDRQQRRPCQEFLTSLWKRAARPASPRSTTSSAPLPGPNSRIAWP